MLTRRRASHEIRLRRVRAVEAVANTGQIGPIARDPEVVDFNDTVGVEDDLEVVWRALAKAGNGLESHHDSSRPLVNDDRSARARVEVTTERCDARKAEVVGDMVAQRAGPIAKGHVTIGADVHICVADAEEVQLLHLLESIARTVVVTE